MRIIDFAKMLTETINDKINQSRGEMHESHNPVYNQSLLIEIQALEWAQGQIQYLVIIKKGKRYRIINDQSSAFYKMEPMAFS
jgi:hypothetical protein